MKLLQGKKIADKILSSLKKKISAQKNKPSLAVILVGNDKASQLYIRLKKKAAERIGINFQLFRFSSKVKETAIIQKIRELNASKKISGMIVQLPLPKNLHTQKIINTVDPRKDVDGFSAKNIINLQPVFPQAIMEMLYASFLKVPFRKEAKAVVIANSEKFGEVMVDMLMRKKISGTYILSSKLKKSIEKVQKADIIISAMGRPGLITDKIIKQDAIIIDGGITKKGKKVLGDIDFDSVKNKASFLTPVPGGVGPVTIACLLKNTYLASRNHTKI
ncbi:bifunctional 5,10-methylenetetrahydrofolate dehydrogenase/5,10-methenyltetrahydrofolate cyclohydrolase [Patescibacteria group bacterium]|nr:bifunctional 5,10-methylenetetrahydrofolate dehydrogenase/5,10-methenyltetrahydrofolate cyclohydrolase [Patescibacteria group bacterium]